MKQIKLAIFDFDGTLADSFPFFVSVFNQLAQQHRFDPIDLNNACAFRSYSMRQMMRHVGMPQWKLPIVARSFMGLMKENVARIGVFEGMSEVLSHLDACGIKLAIVTSNSHENVVAVLGKGIMDKMLHVEASASLFSKASRIRRTLEKAGVGGAEAVYVGDQVSDLQAARKAGVAFGAVAWGYATMESLLAHSPEHAFHAVGDIKLLAV